MSDEHGERAKSEALTEADLTEVVGGGIIKSDITVDPS
jgi:hypothetical protein